MLDSPGQIRTGIVRGPKLYETDGATPVGVHEASAARLLAPIGRPPSVRWFFGPGFETGGPIVSYGNPSSVIGPNMIVPWPGFSGNLDVEMYLAIVIGGQGSNIPVELADEAVLGFMVACSLVARDAEREERTAQTGPGRSRDVAIAVGPALTTPEELDDLAENTPAGRRYNLGAAMRINGVEARRGSACELPWTPAQAIATASESAPLATGDLLLLGPIPRAADPARRLEPGDEIACAIDHLGALALKVAP